MDLTLVIGIPIAVYALVMVFGLAIWFACSRRNTKNVPAAPTTAADNTVKLAEEDVESQSTNRISLSTQDFEMADVQSSATVVRAIGGLKAPSHSAPPEGQSELVIIRQELRDLLKRRQDSIEVSSSGYVFKDINVSPAIRLKKAMTVQLEREQQKPAKSVLSYFGFGGSLC